MPGIRVDRLLASTAVALLLAASVGAALADPSNATGDKPVSAAPASAAPGQRGSGSRDSGRTRDAPAQRKTAAPRNAKIDTSGSATTTASGSGRRRPLQANPTPAAPSAADGQHAGSLQPRDGRRAARRAPRPRRRHRRSVARTRQRQVRPRDQQQERPDADRRVLFRPQLQAAVDHRRQGQRQRQGGDRLSRPCRCRRAVSVRLSGAEFRVALDACRSRQCRARADNVGHYLRASCQHRPRRLLARVAPISNTTGRRRNRPTCSPASQTPKT